MLIFHLNQYSIGKANVLYNIVFYEYDIIEGPPANIQTLQNEYYKLFDQFRGNAPRAYDDNYYAQVKQFFENQGLIPPYPEETHEVEECFVDWLIKYKGFKKPDYTTFRQDYYVEKL